jgi:type 1 glutamine amidotransferase
MVSGVIELLTSEVRTMNSLLLILALTISAAPKDDASVGSIRVLVVSGEDHPAHHWKKTGPVIRKVLEKDKRFDVRIVEDREFLASAAIFDYDVLFLHFKDYKPTAREQEIRDNLVKFTKQGKGLVVFHFACGAFGDWPEFEKVAGKVWDKKTGHDRRREYTVNITDKDHPITRGMKDFQADDELYTCLVGKQSVRVLATSRSENTGKDHPMAFVLEYGKGRVFHTPLGHDVRSIEMPGVAELIRRGCLWTARQLP